MEKIKLKNEKLELIAAICCQIFSVLLIGYLFLFLIDQLFENIISIFVNLNYLLWVVVISGLLAAILPAKQITAKDKPMPSRLNFVIAVVLGIIAIIVIFVKILSVGWIISGIISLLAGALICLIALLFLDTD